MMKKSAKMKVAELKAQLIKLTQQEMIELLVECYKISDEVQGLISVRLKGSEGVLEILSDYEQRIKTEFFPTRGHGKLRVTEVKKLISEFNKISNESESTFELLLFFLNKETTEDLFVKYKDRLKAIVNIKGIECWGIHDSLEGSYLDIKWIEYEAEEAESRRINRFRH